MSIENADAMPKPNTDQTNQLAQGKLQEEYTASKAHSNGDWTTTVQPGNVGILISFGEVDQTPLQEGLSLKLPWKEVVEISTRLMPHSTIANTASKDLQSVSTEVTLPYSINPDLAPAIYQKIGGLEQIDAAVIKPAVLESTKKVTAQFTAEELVTKRAQVKELLDTSISDYVGTTLKKKGLDGALQIGNLAITDFGFSDDFNKSIELKVQAEQEALKAENVKRKTITEAEAQAVKAKLGADASAYSTEVQSKAEADALRFKGDALASNQNIVNLNAIERWDGHLPQTMMGNSPVPFINIDTAMKPHSPSAESHLDDGTTARPYVSRTAHPYSSIVQSDSAKQLPDIDSFSKLISRVRPA